jgi:hypothetical protein
LSHPCATATTCAAGLHVGFHFHGYLRWVKFVLLLGYVTFTFYLIDAEAAEIP